MSRIGKKPIVVPSGVKVEQNGQHIKVTGSLGSMEMDVHPDIKVRVDGSAGQIILENESPEVRHAKELHGTMRALVANMVTGVSKGFERKMEIYGTGYGLKEQSGKLIFTAGYCHTVEKTIPKGLKVVIEVASTRGNEVPAKFLVKGTDKHVLGQFTADIRRIRPPEPYQGKGIRFADEHLKRKVGKAFASGTVA